MTKAEFIEAAKALYRVANHGDVSDDDRAADEMWLVPEMTGPAGCAALDRMFREMLKAGVLTADEHQAIYDTL